MFFFHKFSNRVLTINSVIKYTGIVLGGIGLIFTAFRIIDETNTSGKKFVHVPNAMKVAVETALGSKPEPTAPVAEPMATVSKVVAPRVAAPPLPLEVTTPDLPEKY